MVVDRRALILVAFANACGGGSESTGGVASSDASSGAATSVGEGGTMGSADSGSGIDGESTGDAPPEDPPDGAEPGPVAGVGAPFDPDDDGYPGPPTTIPAGHPKLVAVANPNGSIDVAWLDTLSPQIVLTQIVPDGDGFANAWHVDLPTIDRLAGYARDDDGNRYVLTTIAEDELLGQTTPTGEHREGIARLVKLSPQGAELFATDLRNDVGGNWPDPLVAPMSFGSGRIAVGGGAVAITFSCLTEYDPGVMSRHQRQCFHLVDATTGEQTDHVPGPGHSWEHRMIWDGARFVAVVHGDAGLRGVGLVTYGPPTPYVQRVAFAVKGGDASTGGAYQNTFTRFGDVVVGDGGYAVLFASENDPAYMGASVIASRNLAFVHVRADFEATMVVGDNPYDIEIVDTQNPAAVDFPVQIVDYWGGSYDGLNTGIVWLTDHADPAAANVESPKLVRLDSGEYLALWEQWNASAPTGLFAMVLDEHGNVLTPATALGEGRLYRADPLVSLGDRAAWVIGDSSVPQLVLFTVDAALTLSRFDLP
jgi:hypothetical protein